MVNLSKELLEKLAVDKRLSAVQISSYVRQELRTIVQDIERSAKQ